MFVIRSATLQDLDGLYELSQLANFINLPADRDKITTLLKKSERSFISPNLNKFEENYYVFVLEDLQANKIIGSSMVHAQHGTKERPHFYLSVGKEQKFSETLNTGMIHGTLKFGLETDGPSEIGGLILDPSYRGHPHKLGKVLSFSRFLFMGLNPNRFKETVHSELLPPFDKEGNSPLWEAIGRRFLHMDYQDADLLSQTNTEFIKNLYPTDTIYVTLLPIDARDAIGKVGPETRPVEKMLKSIGFKYSHEIDPFDGGPHYRAKLKELLPVQNIQQVTLQVDKNLEVEYLPLYLIQLQVEHAPFACSYVQGKLLNKTLTVTETTYKALSPLLGSIEGNANITTL